MIIEWKENNVFPKAERPELSMGHNEGQRKGQAQGAEKSSDAILGHRPHGLLKAVSHVSNSHGLSIFVGESAIKPFCALAIQVFNNKRAIRL